MIQLRKLQINNDFRINVYEKYIFNVYTVLFVKLQFQNEAQNVQKFEEDFVVRHRVPDSVISVVTF